MAAQKSAEFKDFSRAQHQINEFLWSSELAYELILQKMLTKESQTGEVHKIFADVDCHAFVPGTKAYKLIQAGETPPHGGKYEVTVGTFKIHLRENLESVCRYVIIRFHSALERYLWRRCQPLFIRTEMNRKERKAAQKNFQGVSYQDLQNKLSARTSLRAPVDRKIALKAQCYRMVRNEFVHKDDWRPPWSDAKLRKTIEQTFSEKEGKALVELVCKPITKRITRDPSTPALFFYALFCLTDYRKLAEELEKALPFSPKAAGSPT
jgi:hypothetical protein